MELTKKRNAHVAPHVVYTVQAYAIRDGSQLVANLGYGTLQLYALA